MTTTGPRLAVHDVLGRRVVPLQKPVFTIGRRAGHDLQLGGSEVSRDHAEIVETPAGHAIRDCGSTYGTFVNGSRVTEQLLTHGDRIECGRTGTTLVFLTEDAAEQDEAAGVPVVGDLRQVAMLLDALREMGSDRVLDEVLALVLDSAIDATGAERGFIMLADSTGTLKMTLVRRAGHVTLPAQGFETSRKIPEEVFATGRTKVVTDLFEGDLAAVHTGTVALGIRHVLCTPLRLVRYVERLERQPSRANIGVLYLDSREKGRLLSSSTRGALEALAAQAALAIENARLYQEALEKARLDEELSMASRIQQALLPQARRVGRFFEAIGASVPSRVIGGDFFDYQDLSGDHFGFGLGDVTGKGPPAALVTALVQGVLATQAASGATPAGTIALVNRVLLSRPVESRFLTLFLGRLAPDGTLAYCNAAQNPPLVFSADRIRRLETGGTLLGAFPGAQFEEDVVRLEPGDTVVIFSDGIADAEDVNGVAFGEDRIRDAVKGALAEPPDRILQTLFDTVRAFARGGSIFDDLTAVVLRYVGTGRA